MQQAVEGLHPAYGVFDHDTGATYALFCFFCSGVKLGFGLFLDFRGFL